MSDTTPFDAPAVQAIPDYQPAGNVDRAIARASTPDTGAMDYTPLFELAQSLDRTPARLIARAQWLGSMMGDTAYYSFPMGGKPVEGASITLAEALAGEWGGIAHEMLILSAHPLPSGGQRIHLRARCIDIQRVVIGVADAVATTAPPPGKFAGKLDQIERWHAMQIQSAGSKIKRNAILDVIPSWLVNIALDAARANATATILGGATMQEKFAESVAWLGRKGLTVSDLVAILRQPAELWAMPQLRELRDTIIALRDGETTVAALRAGAAETTRPTPGPAHGGVRPSTRPTEAPALPDSGPPVDEFAGVDPREEQREVVPVEETPKPKRQRKAPDVEAPGEPAAPVEPVKPRQFASEYIRDLKDRLTSRPALATAYQAVFGRPPAFNLQPVEMRDEMARELVRRGELDPDPAE